MSWTCTIICFVYCKELDRCIWNHLAVKIVFYLSDLVKIVKDCIACMHLWKKTTQTYYCVNRRFMEELKERRIIYDLFNAWMNVEL